MLIIIKYKYNDINSWISSEYAGIHNVSGDYFSLTQNYIRKFWNS